MQSVDAYSTKVIFIKMKMKTSLIHDSILEENRRLSFFSEKNIILHYENYKIQSTMSIYYFISHLFHTCNFSLPSFNKNDKT